MASRKQITLGLALAVGILGALTAVWIAVPLFVIAGLLFAWGLEPKRTEESIGRLPYGSSYILEALAKLDSMLSKLARVTEEQLDEKKNVVAPDDQESQSAVMQPTAPAIPEPGELEIKPPDLQPTPPIAPESPAPPEVPPQQPPAQPPQPPQMKSALGNITGVDPDSKD